MAKKEKRLVFYVSKTKVKGDHYIVIRNNQDQEEASIAGTAVLLLSDLKKMEYSIRNYLQKIVQAYPKSLSTRGYKMVFNKESFIEFSGSERVYPLSEEEIDVIFEITERPNN